MTAKRRSWIMDSDGSTLYANSSMGEILGADPTELLGKTSFAYVFPEGPEAAGRLFESKQKRDVNPLHFRLRRKDGSPLGWLRKERQCTISQEILGNRGHFYGFGQAGLRGGYSETLCSSFCERRTRSTE